MARARPLARAGAWLVLASAAGCQNPPGPMRAWTPPERDSAALTAWIADDSDEIGPETPSATRTAVYSAIDRTVRLRAAINETVAFQVVLSTARPPAGPFNVQISDLTGPGESIDARSSVALFHAFYVPISRYSSWYPGHAGRAATPRLFADVLVPWDAPRHGGPVSLDGVRNEIVWVDVAIPPTAEPGDYSGTLNVTRVGARRPDFECRIEIEVLPVAIPGPRALPIICRVDPDPLLREHLRWDRESARRARLVPGVPNHQAAISLVNQTIELFHRHRTNPVLWGSFPRYRPTGERSVEIDWTPYDALVENWLDGTAFDDGVGLAVWPLPADWDHPATELEGGFDSPRYARLLAAYLANCRAHFAQRGWLDRSFVRLRGPQPLTADETARIRRGGGILRQSETGVPYAAHLPPRSLRPLGWYNAPAIDQPDVNIWIPPASWLEPAAARTERGLSRRVWFAPDRPPYSGSVAVEAPPVDARILGWHAFLHDLDGVWLEHATDFGAAPLEPDASGGAAAHDWLVYPGAPFGLVDRVIPSVRLKRLRRGELDFELLTLLDRQGMSLLARSVAEQVAPWAFTDAALDNLLDARPASWPRDAEVLGLARELVLQEIANESADQAKGRSRQIAAIARWSRLMNRAARIQVETEGARLVLQPDGMHVWMQLAVTNAGPEIVQGAWQLASAPVGWSASARTPASIPPRGRFVDRLDVRIAGLGFGPDGVVSVPLVFDTPRFGAFPASARFAAATCPRVADPPTIDGNLADWPDVPTNVAGDFRLCPLAPPALGAARDDRPQSPTTAYLCHDRDNLYVAVRCAIPDGTGPLWNADNHVPMDGLMPWGQDTVELLLSPQNVPQGSAGELYTLQIKPSGFMAAWRGCPSSPPVAPCETWNPGARVAVRSATHEWTVELALPLAAFGSAGSDSRIWGLNVTRLDARRGEYSSWSGARRHCYSPERLGNLVFSRD